MRKSLVFAAIVALAAVAAGVSVLAPAASVEAQPQGKPEVIAATFASAWCSTCKVLKPRLARVVPEFKSSPVKFVEYDFTFGDRDSARRQAQADGVETAFDQYAKGTGYTLLIDADTGDVIDILTMSYSEDAMKAAIARALSVANRS